VIQHGTQQRSSANVAGLHEMINAGKFGKLKIFLRLLLQAAYRHRIQESVRTAAESGLEPVAWACRD
jgi:hypothetical protein